MSTKSELAAVEMNEMNSKNKGIGVILASVFVISLASAPGFIVLPRAMANTGWTALALMPVLVSVVCFNGFTILKCWLYLQKNFDHFRGPIREPYQEIGYAAFGNFGRTMVSSTICISLLGSCIVYLIVISQFLQTFIKSFSICNLIIITGLALIPLVMLGTPKDFWQMTVFAVVVTLAGCIAIPIDLLCNRDIYSVQSLKTFKPETSQNIDQYLLDNFLVLPKLHKIGELEKHILVIENLVNKIENEIERKHDSTKNEKHLNDSTNLFSKLEKLKRFRSEKIVEINRTSTSLDFEVNRGQNLHNVKNYSIANNLTNLAHDEKESENSSDYLTFEQLYKGTATLMFTFAGVSCWPSIQNDMKHKQKFWQSIILGNVGLLLKFSPMMIASYVVLGANTPDNILKYGDSIVNTVTTAFITINVVACYLMTFNPFCQTLEKVFRVPQEFGVSRCVLRGGFVMLQIIIAISCPDFGHVVNLVGATTCTCTSFVFPALFYLKLAYDSRFEKDDKKLKISKLEIFLIVGLTVLFTLLGTTTTITIASELINIEFSESCLSKFF